jgi:V/A-type H+/Na+-transporting ATPase subunit B
MMKKFYHKIETIVGPVITLKAQNIAYGEIARVHKSNGEKTLAQVIAINGGSISLQVFSGSKGIRTDDRVEFLGHSIKLNFLKDHLLGRIFNGSGDPIDNRPALGHAEKMDIAGPSFNPVKRVVPSKMIATGLPMIDLFNTLVESQKLPIFSVAGEPYNELLARIALQAGADIIILGAMGVKYDEFLFFKNELESRRHQTIMFIHTASDPVVECVLIPDLALAAAEIYAVLGKKVLVLLTDMTAFSDSLKEISIAMDKIPSNRGYPGDLYSQLAARYEKAVDIEGAGSITLLAVTTMPGDDVTHPVPDNTGYITEGQFYLKNGRIDPFGSLSRLKQLVNKTTRADHASLMNTMIRLYDEAKKIRQQQAMGFSISLYDEKLLGFAFEFEEKMMDLSVNLPLFAQLDLGWQILSNHFSKEEIDTPRKLVEQFWPPENGLE